MKNKVIFGLAGVLITITQLGCMAMNDSRLSTANMLHPPGKPIMTLGMPVERIVDLWGSPSAVLSDFNNHSSLFWLTGGANSYEYHYDLLDGGYCLFIDRNSGRVALMGFIPPGYLNDLKRKNDLKRLNDLLGKSVDLYKSSKYQESIDACDEALSIKPSCKEAMVNKGNSLIKLGRFAEGIASYDEALNLDPEFAVAWYDRAWAYSNMREKSAALNDLQKAINLDAQYQKKARKEKDFQWLEEDEEFKKIIGK